MMSEIEDEVMVKPANTSNKCTSLHQGCSHPHTHNPVHDDYHHLSDLSSLIFDAPDVNHARVEFLKREISSGRYQIASNQIAMRMLANS